MPLPSFDWTNRRRWLFAVSAFCMIVISYVLYQGSDTRLAETALNCSFILLGSIGATYIGGAAFEHAQIAKATARNTDM